MWVQRWISNLTVKIMPPKQRMRSAPRRISPSADIIHNSRWSLSVMRNPFAHRSPGPLSIAFLYLSLSLYLRPTSDGKSLKQISQRIRTPRRRFQFQGGSRWERIVFLSVRAFVRVCCSRARSSPKWLVVHTFLHSHTRAHIHSTVDRVCNSSSVTVPEFRGGSRADHNIALLRRNCAPRQRVEKVE